MNTALSVNMRAEPQRQVLSTVTPSGTWEFSLWEEWPDGEPRLRDLDAAERLQFNRPRDIRPLIERIWPENKRPFLRDTVSRRNVRGGGVQEFKVTEYWLTEAELLKLCARARTTVAEAILDEMIAVYLAVRRHLATGGTFSRLTEADVQRLVDARVQAVVPLLLQGFVLGVQSRPPPSPVYSARRSPAPPHDDAAFEAQVRAWLQTSAAPLGVARRHADDGTLVEHAILTTRDVARGVLKFHEARVAPTLAARIATAMRALGWSYEVVRVRRNLGSVSLPNFVSGPTVRAWVAPVEWCAARSS